MRPARNIMEYLIKHKKKFLYILYLIIGLWVLLLITNSAILFSEEKVNGVTFCKFWNGRGVIEDAWGSHFMPYCPFVYRLGMFN